MEKQKLRSHLFQDPERETTHRREQGATRLRQTWKPSKY
jgi:hypothetical protein